MIGSRGPQMLATTLPHVDMWNGWYAWSGNTTAGYAMLHAEIDAAIEAAGTEPGRDRADDGHPASFPEEGGPVDPRATLIQGDVEIMAEAVLALGRAGVGHIQVVLEPCTPAAVERFGRALELIRAGWDQ